MKSENGPSKMDVNAYKKLISSMIGKEISIIVNPNGHSERKVLGIVSFASSQLFGVKVNTDVGDYVLSFSYIEIFIGKIKILNN